MYSHFTRFLLISIGIALLVPAPVALFSPSLAASAFGVPCSSEEARVYLLATGTRDVALGVWLLSMVVLRAEPRLLAASLWSIAIVAVGDALTVGFYNEWRSARQLAPHVGGAVVLIMAGFWLWRGKRQPPAKCNDGEG